MKLVDGIHHLTFITSDMDRLIAFYERIFDAEITMDLTEGPVRHTFIEIGPETVLHPFQLPDVEVPGSLPMFQRGRLDHFCLNTPSEEAFWELHKRAQQEDCLDGDVIDMGMILLFSFTDPDGALHEIAWWKPGRPTEGIRREAWQTISV